MFFCSLLRVCFSYIDGPIFDVERVTVLVSAGDKVWKSSLWTPALRASTLLRGFDTGQYDLRLAVRSDSTRGPTSTGPIQLVSVDANLFRLQDGTHFSYSRVACSVTNPQILELICMFFVVEWFGAIGGLRNKNTESMSTFSC